MIKEPIKNKTWYNKLNKKVNSFLKFGIITLIVFFVLIFSPGYSEYMGFNKINCTVVDRVSSPGRHSTTFYLILREPNGRLFDRIVTPTDYSQSKKGDVYIINLREFDIRQTPTKNTVYFLAPCVLLSFAIGFLLGGTIIFVNKKEKK